ncbi:MAG: 1-acyl-sn-glycerol-3-phosphate acyltransferase [Gammaproteobacteria bacterium]|nr:1-acyl-sn-glycerol-3-phosphate acyltransferase [Gammaproteobacteria bacterium]
MMRHARRMQRLARLALHVTAGVVVTYLILAPANAMGGDPTRRAQRALVRWWMAGICRILNLRIRTEGEVCGEPVLLVANHISWLDVPCLLATVDAVCLSKSEVKAWPVVGALAAHAGTLFIRRGEHTAAGVADQMARSLQGSLSVVFFPEGTSTDGATVRTFHPRLYHAAIQAQASVQAVAIAYPHPAGVNPVAPYINDINLLDHLWGVLAEPAVDVRLTFCEPVTAVGDRRTLAAKTRSQILEALYKSSVSHSGQSV